MTRYYPIIGALTGVAVTYICGAVVAWDFNPGNWSGLWRFLCVVFALFWSMFGASLGSSLK